MLKKYEEKRDFSVTPEPPPAPAAARTGALLFVVQKHAATRLHYDFRLELDGALKSWSVPKGPSLDPAEKRLAVLVEDHPLEYRAFEGVIPRGEYGAGQVIVWDHGTYSPDEGGSLSFDDRAEAERRMREGFEKGKLSIFLRGRKLSGSWTLVRMKGSPRNWLLMKHKDEFASTSRDVLQEGRSAVSGLTIDDLKAGKLPFAGPQPPADLAGLPQASKSLMPSSVQPMLASLVRQPFDDPAWFFEPKLDGYRVIAFVKGGKVRLQSRGGLDVTDRYALLVPELARQPVSEMVLDGEIIALDERGRDCFQCLQRYLQAVQRAPRAGTEPTMPLVYYVFDILYQDGYDLARVPLSQRKAALATALQPTQHVRLVDYFEGGGKALFAAAIQNGLEGVMAKRRDSIYEPGRRSVAWLKIKATLSDDFVIGGYTQGKGLRSNSFGALLLGHYESSDKLTYAGHVGTGFNEQVLGELLRQLKKVKTAESPFREPPPVNAPATWVRPELVAEIKYAEVTDEGLLRVPVFLRLRPDKAALEVRRPAGMSAPDVSVSQPRAPARPGADDSLQGVLRQLQGGQNDLILEVEGQRLSLSNLNKELWPATAQSRGVTKRDLIAYLATVSPHFLPHLRDRPLTFSRYPDGIGGEHFFQKHWATALPDFVETVMLSSEHLGRRQRYMLCNNLPTLLWLGQVANLEIHTWFSRVTPEPELAEANDADRLVDLPDFVIFDIDPYIYSGSEARGAEPELNRKAFFRAGEVVLWLKQALDSLSLPAFVKTSGATGFHIHLPLKRGLDYRQVRSAALTVGQFVQKQHPGDVTLDWTVSRRTGKVFIDYNQNARGKTLASVYSPRPTALATVSTPLQWEEVGRVYPTDFTIFTVPERLKRTGDIWQEMTDAAVDLRSLLGK